MLSGKMHEDFFQNILELLRWAWMTLGFVILGQPWVVPPIQTLFVPSFVIAFSWVECFCPPYSLWWKHQILVTQSKRLQALIGLLTVGEVRILIQILYILDHIIHSFCISIVLIRSLQPIQIKYEHNNVAILMLYDVIV